jgi:hypothetical protein
MKIRFIFPVGVLLVLASACGGSSSSSVVTLGDKAVSTSLAPESNSNFCKNAASTIGVMESASSVMGDSDEDPEQFWKSVLTLAMKMLEDAPNEIRDEAENLQKGIAGYAAVFAKYDYDMMAIALDPEATAAVESLDAGGKMTAASESVDKYLEESCGIPQE